MNPREELKRRLYRERPWTDDYPPLRGVCGVDLNEVLYTKGDFRGLSAAKRQYMDSEINCAINSHDFHMQHGHTSWYRRWFVEQQIARYGSDAVDEYLRNAPLKITKRLQQFLTAEDPPMASTSAATAPQKSA